LFEANSPQQMWEAALGELQLQVNKANYDTWLKKTIGLNYQGNEFVVGVPNTFVAEYLDRNQRSLIEKVLTGLLHRETEVEFRVEASQPDTGLSHGFRARAGTQQASLPLFNPKYTFDSFIKGKCNQLACAAAQTIAQNPGQSYNPLFIYGAAGLGKTHLLQAIGHTALANNMKVLYASAEQFTNELMVALRERKTQEFCYKFRSADMLLIDDVQFFSGKNKTAENFFHTFDELHNANRQIALTSDRPPQAIPLLSERLRSCFEWGLVTEIQPPDFETRLAILQDKAKQDGVNVSLDVLELIARQIQQNIRVLEGSLNRVIAYAKLVRAMVTPELATHALKDIAHSEPRPALLTPSLILETVARSFQLTPADLASKKRDKETTMARRVAMYLIRQETNCSLAQIGQELGGRDAAAVTNACKKVAGDINASPYLRRKIRDIQQTINPTKD
jgi:chromosomal replication initiator protein